MSLAEYALTAEPLTDIRGSAREGLEALGLSRSDSQPSEVVDGVDLAVKHLQKKGVEGDPALVAMLGSLWGESLVREFAWEWVMLAETEEQAAHAVVSEDRSLASYPYRCIDRCLKRKPDVTILLAFNILKEKSSVPPIDARSYTNVMAHVRHIVPPV